ncbi:MAG TPA: polyhydroxyalkanoate synthesis regulator DNA-binding domain-containing protein [Turneriella sp.]|nr:polyhydroxyalkanoate synthesis regulator DNA-binding domain-containing protein [Turneriella sp.]
MKIIKRYANRRLYDPETSRTITLDEVAQYVRDGLDIKVIDNTNGEDITRKVLGQTFLKLNDSDRIANPVLQNQMLKLLIRESKDGVIEVLKKLVLAGVGMTQSTSEERKTLLEMLINPSEAHEQEQRAFLKGLADKGQQEADRVLQSISGVVSSISQSIQENMISVLDPNERARKLDGLLNQIENIQKSISKFSKSESESAKNNAVSNAKVG